ncbi:hypothetical protein A6F68_01400 [Tsuneonella dongtanensis]|uniref:YnbE-like lipoprotein n=2 Tax=Tsuneonella dongtanensis TaxID=692370 RepID=A0A1B2ACP2_9SPHN|nr:hypothetical protein A6F68_01400 [Tsuneonella dongtanensis]
MMHRELTRPHGLATISSMTGDPRKSGWGRALPAMMLGAAMLGGCVQVTAPDKPIVIELNVNIRQEVIYRLAADAGNTIEENEDIF